MIDNNKDNSDINISSVNATKEKKSLESDCKINNVIDPQDNKIVQLKTKLAQLEERERDTILRLKAEIENIRRRNIQEIEKTYKFSLERFVLELLPVIDNLERTINNIDRSNTTLSGIIEGVELTLKSFLDTMYKFGVESVHDVKVPFNPEVHQAISTIESEECQSNQVLSIIQKGYRLNGRLIRPAMVTVSCSKC